MVLNGTSEQGYFFVYYFVFFVVRYVVYNRKQALYQT